MISRTAAVFSSYSLNDADETNFKYFPVSPLMALFAPCWKAANVPVLNDSLVLLRFAFQTRPFDNWPIHDLSPDHHAKVDPSPEPPRPLFNLGNNELLPFDSRHLNGTTDLGRLLLRLSNMSLEIQSQVTKRLSLTLLQSLIRTKMFVTELLHVPQVTG